MSARKSLFLVFDVVDQYVFTQIVRFCIENSATIEFAHLLNKGLQVIALVQHEGIDGDVLGGAASNSAQCLADSGGCWRIGESRSTVLQVCGRFTIGDHNDLPRTLLMPGQKFLGED